MNLTRRLEMLERQAPTGATLADMLDTARMRAKAGPCPTTDELKGRVAQHHANGFHELADALERTISMR